MYYMILFCGTVYYSIYIGIEVIKLRATAMEAAARQSNGGMLTVFLNQSAQLRTAIVAAKDYCRDKLQVEDPICNIAAHLTIGVRVVAGHEEVLFLSLINSVIKHVIFSVLF